MTTVLRRGSRYLLIGASLCAAAAFAAQPPSSAESAASGKRSGKSAPSKKKGDAPDQWDRVDPGTSERASKGSTQKPPSFPAERR
jgi:hypothetical protein